MQSMDFVFVQFYNNGQCNIGQSGFIDSFKAWSSDLTAKGVGPKLYIGAPGCPACAGSGYLDPNTLRSVVSSAKSAGVSNFGGIMLWDGPEAIQNKAGGSDYLEAVKSLLA
jgi:chitinase